MNLKVKNLGRSVHLVVGFQSSQKAVAGLLGVSQQHGVVLVKEDGVVDGSVTNTEGPLHNNRLSGLPYPENWHAGNDGVGVVLGGGVDCVVGADDQREVDVIPVLVDLVHLVDNIIGHASLCKEHIKLAGHSACNRVDSEFDVLALLPQKRDHLSNRVLTLSNSQPISRHDHNVPSISNGFHGLVNLPDTGGSEAPKDDIGKGSVHSDAHDIAENSSAGADQTSDHSHQVVVQHESLSTEGPSGIGVKDSDYDRHVSTANGHGKRNSHNARKSSSRAKHAHAHAQLRSHQEVAHSAYVSGQQTSVNSMSSWQHQGVGVQLAVELAISNQGASEGDATNVGAEEEGRLDHGGGRVSGKTRVVIQIGGKAGQHCSHANQRVEGCNKLRKVSDLDLLGNCSAKSATTSGNDCHLRQHLWVRLKQAQGGSNTRGHTNHTKSIAKPGSWLCRKATKGTNTS